MTREEQLQNAQDKANAARALLDQYLDLSKQMNQLCPPGYFSTVKQRNKAESMPVVLERVRHLYAAPDRIRASHRMEDERAKNVAQTAANEANQRELEAKRLLLTDESIAYLIAQGQVIGQDFTAANAVKSALEFAVTAEINKRTEANEEEYLKHECSECSAWFPQDHRCSCGNRRMTYSYNGASFKDFYIYPDAY